MGGYGFKRYPGIAAVIMQYEGDDTKEMCIESGKLRNVANALIAMADDDDRLAAGLSVKAPPPKPDDEACGIGPKKEWRPRKYEDDHASLPDTLRKMRVCCAEGNVPLVLDWDGFIKHAEELEEKAKECDSLSQNLWVANDHAISLAKQRDGLAILVADMTDAIGFESLAFNDRSKNWKERLVELTKDSPKCT